MATLGAKPTRSNAGAPRAAHGQSTTHTRSAETIMLSARRSRCSSVSPAAASTQRDSSSASRSRCRRHHSSVPSGAPAAAASSQLANSPRQSSSTDRASGTGQGVRSANSSSIESTTRRSSSSRHGRCGCRPSTSWSSRATHVPSSYDASSRGAGAASGSAAVIFASRRCMSGDSAFASDETALTNARVPSAPTNRAATPGENPPSCVTADTTRDPSSASTHARIRTGRSEYGSRTPSAAGAVMPPWCVSTDPARIRNFCIIAHIDHGKSTLADRMLEFTGIVEGRDMRAQYLDKMDIERERGITIKSQAVRLPWKLDGVDYVLDLIDTPGHVDFSYEVSRSLAACEGAILLVDAAQGIEAQTLANLYLALENDLHIIPVLNKIDLPAAQPDKYAEEVAKIIGCDPEDVLRISAKTGEGVPDVLNAICRDVPPPMGTVDAPARAMIFDSVYDSYRGVITYVRVFDGQLSTKDRGLMMSTQNQHEILEVGVVSPEMMPTETLSAGEVGYVIPGVKNVRQARVGDTLTTVRNSARESLGGYRDPKPMVFSGLYPLDGSEYPALREALDKLRLNDAALVYEPETSAALGFGFRVGFLGLLHLEIVRERLEREFDLSLIATAPNVVYRVVMEGGSQVTVTNPSDWPSGKIDKVYEPIVNATII